MAFYYRGNSNPNFVISFYNNPKDEFGCFAKGYYNAASRLAKDLLSGDHFPDYDAYPVVFLYRHSLELYLKSVIYKSALLMAFKDMEDIDIKLYNNHNLFDLSKISIEIIQRLFPHNEFTLQLSKEIQRICASLSDIDHDSYSYRYPIDTKGNFSTKKHQVVNLEELYSEMDKFLDDMDTLDFGINIETDKAQKIWETINKVRDFK